MAITERPDQSLAQLQQLGALISKTIASYSASKNERTKDEGNLPSHAAFEAQKILQGAAGMLTELVSDPSSRIIEVALQHYEARALHIAAALRIPDILAEHGEGGCGIHELSERVSIEWKKLSRVMRCLCSIHIFREISEDVFVNNAISASLIGNDPLRAYCLNSGGDLFTAADYLPRYLVDQAKGPDYSVEVTPFQDAIGTQDTRWTWLEEKVKIRDVLDGNQGPNGNKSPYPGVYGTELLNYRQEVANGGDDQREVPRPEHLIFGTAMVGGGRVYGEAHLYDFPWAELGKATVVDVGGGMGGWSLMLSHRYPNLNLVLEDRGPVINQAESQVWPRENPRALQEGRIKFVQHDFFNENPVKNADVYWLRYIIHDWADDYCIRILKGIAAAMGPRSRILICDQVMNTTNGDADLPAAPAPLPANYGYFTRFSHTRDLCVLSVINGIERKPTEFRDLIKQSGLHLNKFWNIRSQVGLVEVVLPDSELRID